MGKSTSAPIRSPRSAQQLKTSTGRKRAPGGGLKADDGVTNPERKLVRVDPDSLAVLTQVGNGNLSLGIREAARRLVEHGDLAAFSVVRHRSRKDGESA